jgi:hypothetical protein
MIDQDALVQPHELSPTEHSSSLARIVEYQFLADLLQEAWFGRQMLIDVMYSSVDAFGYDLVLESGDVVRHVQLKTRARNGSTASYGIQLKLRDRPAGCVVWIGHERVEGTNRLALEYRFFGGAAHERLPDLGDAPVKHAKANAMGEKSVRPGLRAVKLSQFKRLDGMTELLESLFGPAMYRTVHQLVGLRSMNKSASFSASSPR